MRPQLFAALVALRWCRVLIHVVLEAGMGAEAAPADGAAKMAIG